MSTRTELLKLLTENTGVYLSGQKIGEELQVSRNAIWKAMQQLRDEGYHIESKPSVGYRLKTRSNILTEASITGDLRYPCALHVFDIVDSTNNVAKEMPSEISRLWLPPISKRPAEAVWAEASRLRRAPVFT